MVEWPYQCKECEKVFSHKNVLFQHQKTCGKVFSHKNVLFQHQKTHTGERPYTYRKRQKAFIRKPHLPHHQKIHNEENMSDFNVENSLGTTPTSL